MRTRKVQDGQVGFEIRGQSHPKFKRKPQVENPNDIQLDIPNGDLAEGRTYYKTNCASCHHLDVDTNLGPSLRTVYLRRFRTNWSMEYGGGDLNSCQKFIWNRKKLWEFLQNPEKMFLDTAMQLDGINDPFVLASVIDYLQYLRVFTTDSKKIVI
ncbi:unnamed protein product [Paramecium octaurelia]|uniref:Cytochrome c domain-containing protein n=1 Tax=Paramecium octaurelia TaxID=43137 RepID=A0A8S1S5P5_PAROT|nr:unnamed protein product [Paramecium octaurelia]